MKLSAWGIAFHVDLLTNDGITWRRGRSVRPSGARRNADCEIRTLAHWGCLQSAKVKFTSWQISLKSPRLPSFRKCLFFFFIKGLPAPSLCWDLHLCIFPAALHNECLIKPHVETYVAGHAPLIKMCQIPEHLPGLRGWGVGGWVEGLVEGALWPWSSEANECHWSTCRWCVQGQGAALVIRSMEGGSQQRWTIVLNGCHTCEYLKLSYLTKLPG